MDESGSTGAYNGLNKENADVLMAGAMTQSVVAAGALATTLAILL
jgi:hypothetical protein